MEIRENRIASQAAAYQEIGIAVAENWMERANNAELNELIRIANAPDPAGWNALREGLEPRLRGS